MNVFKRTPESEGRQVLAYGSDFFGQWTPRFKPCEAGANPMAKGYRARCRWRAEEKLRAVRELRAAAKREAGQRVRIALRPYQMAVFGDRTSGILILHWARQIGKSFTLAAWAVDRLLTRPGRLVTVLSNSRENGAEFVAKCAEVCRLNGTSFETADSSRGVQFQNMRMEVRIRAKGKTGRIKVVAANPRTARGFSGDLILDEFAFHEDSGAIWEAAEPILASNADYLCRIASTGNGKHNLFYRMTEGMTERVPIYAREGGGTNEDGGLRLEDSEEGKVGKSENRIGGVEPLIGANGEKLGRGGIQQEVTEETEGDEGRIKIKSKIMIMREGEDDGCHGVLLGTGIGRSRAGFGVSRITRTEAFEMGVKIYDANSRREVTPSQARAAALDKRAYDQNYECAFADESLTLLSHELISAAERDDVGFVCEQDWGNPVSELVSERMSEWNGPSPREEVRNAECGVRNLENEDPSPRPSPHRMGERETNPPSYDGGYEDGEEKEPYYPQSHDSGHGDGEDKSQCYPPSHNGGHSHRRRISPLEFLRQAQGRLYVGFDVARRGDLSVITVMEDLNGLMAVRGILRMQNLRLPEQQLRLGEVCRLPRFHRAAIDMTGLGLGLFEYAQKEFGSGRIHGINFGASVAATRAVRREGRAVERVRVTEALALELLQVYEARRIQHPSDDRLRDDLRKPERVTTPGGRVSIAASRDEAGHADHFWSFALALDAAGMGGGGGGIEVIRRERRVLL